MKNLLFPILFFFSLLFSPVLGQNSADPFASLWEILESKNYFKAAERYQDQKENLAPEEQKLVEAYLDNAFNRLKDSRKKLRKMLHKPGTFPDSLYLKLWELRVENAVKLYRYDEAVEAARTLIQKYGDHLSPSEKKDFQNDAQIWGSLEQAPPQKLKVRKRLVWQLQSDVAGLKNLRASLGQDSLPFIFDTGANLSTTVESVAERWGMEQYPSPIEVMSITGEKVPAHLALCKELWVEGLRVRNLIFLVFPDEALYVPQIDYQIYGILGYPFIEALGELHIGQNGEILVPKQSTTHSGPSNLAMDGLTPLIHLNGRHYSFDTGADHTMLYRAYFEENKSWIEESYTLQEIGFAGAGGGVKVEGYAIPWEVSVSGKEIKLQEVPVFIEKVKEKETVYGNVGQDLIRQFPTMILNFREMYIRFE